jgi:hypothetical protein
VLVQHSSGRKRGAVVLGQWRGEPLANAAGDLPRLLTDVLSQAGVSGMPVRVVLADALVRSWTVQPPENASRLQDCEAAAAMRFTAVFGDSAADWHISAAYDARYAFLACALQRSMLAALLQVLQARRLQLLSMEPECVALWNHWKPHLPDAAWFGICNDSSLLLGMVVDGRMQGTRRLALAGPQCREREWLVQVLQREAARLNLPAPRAIGLCGQVPADWTGLHLSGLHCAALGSICDALTLFGVHT